MTSEADGPWWDFTTGDLSRDRGNLRLVMETVGELYGLVDARERMRRAVDRAIALTGAERGILLLKRPGLGALVPHVAREKEGGDVDLSSLRFSQTAVRTAWESGRLHRNIMPADDDDDENGDLTKSVVDLRLYSVMAAPLVYEERAMGVLYLDATYRPDTEFTEKEERVFRTLGGLIAAALENARLERARIERDRIRRHVDLARDVQQRLVPETLPQAEGLEFAGVGRVCEAMSGDYYDVIPRPDGRLGLVVGDVSGHGIDAALYMAMTRALAHLLLEQTDDPAACLAEVNRFLERDMKPGKFMSLFLGLVEPGTRRFVYASAGHNPPMLWSSNGGLRELEPTGPILGALPTARFTNRDEGALAPGDVLLLYTDGLFESKDPSGEMYEEERLRASLDGHAASGNSASAVLDGVLADLDAFRRGQPLEDDITALVCRAV